ncbi:MAG TPA: rhodanese-like domain-containing protein [Rhizomicrobium sp.]
MEVEIDPGYAGDLPAREAWSALAADPSSQLVDVRTAAEWAFVGIPDLSAAGRDVRLVEWQSFPSGTANPDFAEKAGRILHEAGAGLDTPILFLCRSGGRSRAAAIAMTKARWTRAYNIIGGFEGDLDDERHRGGRNGWKSSGLPWLQT